MEVVDLKEYEKNPRKNEEAVKYVADSIKEFGFKVPIVIDKENVIVCGHTRYKAAKRLGINTIPCIMADDLTDDQIKAFRLADNKTAEYSSWDDDFLKLELEDLKITDIDMSEFGFDLSDFELLDEDEIIEDEIPEIDEEIDAVAKLGDIWQLGRHRLICGDSTDPQVVERLMNGEKADLYITDPPYNVNYEGETKEKLKIKNDSMGDADFVEFLTSAFQVANSVMKNGASFYIWHAATEGYNFRKSCREIGWQIRQCLIWNKNVFSLGRQDYQWKHEPCLYGWKDGEAHFWGSDRKQTTVLDFDKPHRNGEHPTMKPVKLFDYQIKNSTKLNDVVLDTFGGSGTTLIACEQNGRTCHMCELDP